jgi:hypothetical protein
MSFPIPAETRTTTATAPLPAAQHRRVLSHSPRHQRVYNPQRRKSQNSVIQAMITSNNLRNCREVEEMVSQCLMNSDKDSIMCLTAQRYLGGCKN